MNNGIEKEIISGNIFKDAESIRKILEQVLNEREALIRLIHQEIVSYKLALDGIAPVEYLQGLDSLSIDQLIEIYHQLKQSYQKRLAEVYGVDIYRKI